MSMPSAPEAAAEASPPDTARALLRERDFMCLWVARFLAVLGTMAQSTTMGWQIYSLGRSSGLSEAEAALWLGMLGLVTFLPLFILALPAGELADRRPRKWILVVCFLGEIVSALALAAAIWGGFTTIGYMLGVAVIFGIARAFRAPAGTALAPMLVPRNLMPRAIAWNSLSFLTGTILGGPLAGYIIAEASVGHSYVTSLVLYFAAVVVILLIRKPTKPEQQPGSRVELMKEGIRYVWRNKLVLGALSLDLFVVLLGSVIALLPVYAADVLKVGPDGFGLLRAAPASGAALVALYVAFFPPRRYAGLMMFGGVAVFGVFTVVFAVSTWLPLSLAALATLGAADMLSVYVRQTLIQIVTPDPMRGRVAAVSFVFIGASNELGEFESGVTARLFGPVGAAIFGGFAALGVTALWARLFPDLRKADRLH